MHIEFDDWNAIKRHTFVQVWKILNLLGTKNIGIWWPYIPGIYLSYETRYHMTGILYTCHTMISMSGDSRRMMQSYPMLNYSEFRQILLSSNNSNFSCFRTEWLLDCRSRIVYERKQHNQVFYFSPVESNLGKRPVVPFGNTGTFHIPYGSATSNFRTRRQIFLKTSKLF